MYPGIEASVPNPFEYLGAYPEAGYLEAGYAGVNYYPDYPAPPPAAWGATPAGQQLGRQVGELLADVGGGTVSTLGRQLVGDPYVQQQLTQLRQDCQTKAKAGVSEWMRENWWVLIAGGVLLILGNAAMLALAVAPTLRRLVRK